MDSQKIQPIQNERQKGTFVKQVLQDLKALDRMYEKNMFAENRPHIGAELELNVLDKNNFPSFKGYDVYKELNLDQLTTEYARFNLEINSDPIPFRNNCFSELKSNINRPFGILQGEANKQDLNLLLAGIIPALNRRHISRDALTPEKRYEALYDIRKDLHGQGYEIHIRGTDELIVKNNVLLFAGCMTSFQMHLQVSTDEIIDKYNWAQMISGPLLAASTYSPLFLGKKLWSETRIALFEQSTDTRPRDQSMLDKQARVTFGNGWIEDSILEIFRQDLVDYEPMFMNTNPEEPLDKVNNNITPKLYSWNLFNSSVYRWNRICYGITPEDEPSLRIENRILPAGPTMEDQIANFAFWAGLMNGLPDKYKELQNKISFEKAKSNFLKAAHLGLEVQFEWFDEALVSARELIIEELLPIAREGLKKASINRHEAGHYLQIIEERVKSGKTGSKWLLNNYEQLKESCKEEDALSTLTSAMLDRQQTDQPVHTWDPIQPPTKHVSDERFSKVNEVMSSKPHKISEDTVVDLAAHIMKWKKIGHILVEDKDGALVGVLNKNAIINFLIDGKDRNSPVTVREMMFKDPVTVQPDTHLREAIEIILKHNLSCLPVVDENRAVGIITNQDFVSLSKFLISEKSNNNNGNS